MKKVFAAVFATAAILVLAAVIATQLDGAKASEVSDVVLAQAAPGVSNGVSPTVGRSGPEGEQKVLAQHDAEKQSYAGVKISALPPGEAERLGISGGVRVVSVQGDGPSAGKIETGDVITSIDGQGTDGVSEVVETIRAAQPGDVLTFTVVRDDDTLDVDITVGERKGHLLSRFKIFSGLQDGVLNGLPSLGDDLVRAEIVLETDDGFKTVKAVAGPASDIDVAAGTFVVTPVDGSGPVSFQINDDTRIFVGHTGDLDGLVPGDRTVVLEIDGQVKLVLQGDISPGGILAELGSGALDFTFPHFDGPLTDGLRSLGDLPEIRERLRGLVPGFLGEGFKFLDCDSFEHSEDLPFSKHFSFCSDSEQGDTDNSESQ